MKLCINCMSQIETDGECPCCHFEQEGYRSKPRFLPPGTVLKERYVLGRVSGEGNFGITYTGWDLLLESRVAVKEFFPISRVSRNVESGDTDVYVFQEEDYEESLHKYLDEGKRLSRLNQVEGIVSIRDFFYANQTAYIIMEYIEGISIKAYVEKHGVMTSEEALKLMRPVMDALEKVHENGIIHRDISPDNIMMTKENKLVLVDFGSARQVNTMDEQSMTVMIKRGYSSPELYRSHGEQGAWSDVYAICATMYFMFVGNAPDEAIDRILDDETPSLLDMPEVRVPNKIKKVIMKGISVRQKERYQSMKALKEALRSASEMKREIVLWQKIMIGFSVLIFCIAAIALCVSLRHRMSASDSVVKSDVPQVESVGVTEGGAETKEEVQKKTVEAQEEVMTEVPEVVGEKYKKAKKMLQAKELKCKVVWVDSSKEKGTVISQSIAAGKECPKQKRVSIRVSRGVTQEQIQNTNRAESGGSTEEQEYDGVIG